MDEVWGNSGEPKLWPLDKATDDYKSHELAEIHWIMSPLPPSHLKITASNIHALTDERCIVYNVSAVVDKLVKRLFVCLTFDDTMVFDPEKTKDIREKQMEGACWRWELVEWIKIAQG